ncbi:murein transglycosylase [Actinoplanes sp. NPDC051513]|uniref:murein transglycosylase n=1 Tax=Actinoplanes sp. NPDC051513 TaxID=3363908 RepID=UPI00379EB1B6
MANGRETPVGQPELRAAAPHQGGPLGSSGAAPDAGPAREPESTAVGSSVTGDKSEKGDKTGETTAKSANTVESDKKAEPERATEPEKAMAAPAKDTAAPPAKDEKTQPGLTTEAATPAEKAPEPGKPEPGTPEPGTAEAGKATAPEKPASPGRLRNARPVQAVRHASRNTSAWAKRPSGRLVLPAVIALLLLGAAGTAGAYLVPQALEAAPTPSATPAFPGEAGNGAASAPAASLPTDLSTASAPVGATGGFPTGTTAAIPGQTTQGQVGAQTGARPADALTGWAEQIGTKVGIPVVAVQAYGYAELVVAKTMPSCHLSWTTIAALAKVESSHGSANGAVLGADGSVQPPIYGLPLDGKGGRQMVRDTDQGTMDGDVTYDRAVGPLQFIPATWNSYKVDADNNGVADPNDIDDASLTAAIYLCQGGRDLSKAESWWDAILSYNAVQPYAQKVFEAANDYGRRSR